MITVALIERIFAGAIGLLCVALLARQFIGAPRRYRLDSGLRRLGRSLRAAALRLYHGPAIRRRARREAEEAIRRARGDDEGEWQGNVYRPKSFNKPRKLH
jgi:hypothetical protein